ncbi:MAG: SPOR domain-containing protein [Gammaproteobacteria bacterium]|nr:SPOR domain-containing protein [Gammaproteobacteria bacterium]MDH5652295.1 SPOR domain-containing protein [Gammaproteobacteria bacterium]
MVTEMLSNRSLFLSALLYFSSLAFAGTVQAKSVSGYQYVVNVESSYSKNNTAPLVDLKLDRKYAYYTVRVKSRGKTWNRLRLGFFSSRQQANKILMQVRSHYKGAWIDTIQSYEQDEVNKWLVKIGQKNDSTKTDNRFLDDDARSEALLEEARVSMAGQDYDKAIRLYTRVISRGAAKYRQDAQEFLGVAREKKGQFAHAKSEYQEYLRLYPKGEGAERVKQRLAGILTATNLPKAKLKKQKKERPVLVETYGSLFELLRVERRVSDVLTTEYASLSSNLNLLARRRSDKSDIKAQFTGSYLQDFHDPSEKNDARISTMFIDVSDRPKSMSMRLGRQTRNTSGVLGRMDGIWAEYRILPEWQLNVVAGYPVQSNLTNRIQTNRPFYGVSLDLGTFNKFWNYNLFFLTQENDGILDREAMGGELRYVSTKEIYYTMVDYDKSYGELNKIFFVGTWFLENDRSINVTANYGKSPYLMTSNALQGQSYTSVEEMMTAGGYSEEEIRQIARDRTADFHSLTVSWVMPMNKSFNFAADVTLSNLSGTPASAGVLETTSTGNELFYGMQLIGTGIMTKFDTFITGVSFSDTSSSERNRLFINERFNLNDKWRFNPKFTLENTTRADGSQTVSQRPSIKVDYKYGKDISLDVEFMLEKNKTSGAVINVTETAYLLNAGLLVEF